VDGIDLYRVCDAVLVLVLSETVLVLVLESSLYWTYVSSTFDLPRDATTLFLYPSTSCYSSTSTSTSTSTS